MDQSMHDDTEEASIPDEFDVPDLMHSPPDIQEDNIPDRAESMSDGDQAALLSYLQIASPSESSLQQSSQTPRARLIALGERSSGPSQPQPHENISFSSDDAQEEEDEGISLPSLPLPPARTPPCPTTPSRPGQDPVFKKPSSPASASRKSSGKHSSGQESGRRASQPLGAPSSPLALHIQNAAIVARPETPTPNSEASPPPSPTHSHWSDMSVDDLPSSIASFSPYDTPEARRKRKQMPLLDQLPAHGVTTYAPVPDDRSIEVDDVSQLNRRARRANGGLLTAEGSRNGSYLQERLDLEETSEAIVQQDQISIPLVMQHVNIRLREAREFGRDQSDVLVKEKNSWARTVSKLHISTFANTSEWMKDVWGGLVRDKDGDKYDIVRQEATAQGYRPPSTHLTRTAPQLWRRSKRQSESPPEYGSPSKKLKDMLPGRLNKQHRRLTAPAGSITGAGEGGGEPMQRDDSRTYVSGATGHKKKVVLLPPKAPRQKYKTCSRCGAETDGKGLYACLNCGRCVYCSAVCRNQRKNDTCSDICLFENFEKRKGASSSSPSEILEALERLDTVPGSSSNDAATPNQDGSGDVDMLGLSAEEIEEQKEAMKAIERNVKNLKQPTGFHGREGDHTIMGFNVEEGRVLTYRLGNKNFRTTFFARATDLVGQAWTNKIHAFWHSNPKVAGLHYFLEHPDGDDEFEPSPFSRSIVKARLVRDREIVFDVRDFERRDPKSTDDGNWVLAVDLSPERDSVIKGH